MIRQYIYLKKCISYIEDGKYEMEWLVGNMSKVTSGTPLVKFSGFNFNTEKWQTHIVNSECDGICCIHISDADTLSKLSGLNQTSYNYSLYEKEKILIGFVVDDVQDIETIFPCDIIESHDEFSGETSLLWNRLGGLETIGIPLNESGTLYIKSIYAHGKLLLVLDFISNVFNLKKGDTLSLKFMSEQVLDFTITSRPSKVMGNFKFPYEEGNHIELFANRGTCYRSNYYDRLFRHRKFLRETTFMLSTKEIKTIADNLLCAWRITLNSEGGAIVDGEFQSCYFNKEVCPLIINNMFKTLLDHLKKYDSSYSEAALSIEDVNSGEEEEVFDYCYVYLMHDEANDYYKIGMSNKPEYREGTLQSEKPTISLIAFHKYPSRKFAAAIEAALHNVYKDKHVRGEWYKLTNKDVKVIIEGLK